MPSIFRLSFLLLFLSFTLISTAQQQSILIKVVDAKYNPVGFANISIVNKIDSTKITKTVTDSIGISKINIVAKANYTIKVSAIGYKKYSKDYFINDQSSIAIKLTEDPTQLNEVVVKSTKALIRQ